MNEILYRRYQTPEGYAYEPVYPENQVSLDEGKTWQPAKQEPYQLYGIEKLLCMFGFHELVPSKKYAHTKVCFRCGTRRQNTKAYEY